MKAMKLTGIRKMEMHEVPDPKVTGPNEVLIRMGAVGICGSDVHYYTSGKIGSQVVQYPFTVGHEGAGTVVEVGSAVTRVKPGDRIAIEPAMTCGQCDQCMTGRANTCRHNRFLGCPGQVEGCLCEYIVMPDVCCLPIKDSTGFAQATLSEPLAIGVYALKHSIPIQGSTVGILGMGPIGHSVLRPALYAGAAAVYTTDRRDPRCAYAAQAGASYAGNPDRQDVVADILEQEPMGLDVVFECCGMQEAIDQSIELLKPGGKLMQIGIPEVDRISFEIDKMRRKEICLQNVRRQEGCVETALDLIENHKIDMAPVITHSYAFRDTQEALDTVADYRDGVLKAMVIFE